MRFIAVSIRQARRTPGIRRQKLEARPLGPVPAAVNAPKRNSHRILKGSDRGLPAELAGNDQPRVSPLAQRGKAGQTGPMNSNSFLRHAPLALIATAAVLGAVFLRDHLNFQVLNENRDRLLALRDAHYLLTSLGFMLVYVVIVALSLPGATVATLTGGFLFGLFPGTLFNAAAAGTGAIVVFLAARTGLGNAASRRIAAGGGRAARMQRALQANPWSALFAVRLLPLVPFFLANLLPAFAGIRLWPFAVTTYLGILPATLVFTSVGAGLGEVFARGSSPDLGIIFAPHIFLPLLGLAALSALPLIVKLVTGQGGQDGRD